MKNKCDCLCHILPTPIFVCKICGCKKCAFCGGAFSVKKLENHYDNCKKEFIKKYKEPVRTLKDLKDDENEKM